MQKTKVFQLRKVGETRLVLGDNIDGDSYQVAVIRDFRNFFEAMDFMRQAERDLRADGNVCFKDH